VENTHSRWGQTSAATTSATSPQAKEASRDPVEYAGLRERIADVIQQNFAIHNSQPLAFYSVGFYFQDEFKVNSKLKLILALRADRNSGGACQSDCVSRGNVPFDQLSHDATIPFNQMVTTGISQILPTSKESSSNHAWDLLGARRATRL